MVKLFILDGYDSWSCPGLDQHILTEEALKAAVLLSAMQDSDPKVFLDKLNFFLHRVISQISPSLLSFPGAWSANIRLISHEVILTWKYLNLRLYWTWPLF